jgi:ABC-type multidrug transport system ATPase subunit
MTAPAMAQPATSDPLVELQGVGKRYGSGRWVLEAVTVAVAPAATIEVQGANGAGKSTLLRLLAGIGAPSRGRRRVRDQLRIGYGPDGLEPPPPLTLDAYLTHHARIRGLHGADARTRLTDLAERLGFESLLSDRLPHLSRGSLRKAVVAQALLGEPGLLVLDEPFSGLDANAQEALRLLLTERAQAGTAVVISDHREGSERLRADIVWHVDARAVEPRRPPVAPTLARVRR